MLTVVELRCVKVSDGWVCSGGLPDICDRQRAFYPSVERKMSYMSVRVS